jgi:hypothetical protein
LGSTTVLVDGTVVIAPLVVPAVPVADAVGAVPANASPTAMKAAIARSARRAGARGREFWSELASDWA